MKNSVRVLGCAILAAFYCFAVSAVSSANNYSDAAYQQVCEHDQFQASKSTDPFLHTSSSESSVINSSGLTSPIVKKSPGKLWTNATTSDEILATRLARCNSFSVNFFIQLRKAKLVFPFHSFW